MIDWPDAAKQGSLYAAGINAVLLGTLLLTRRWWSLGGAGFQPPADARASGERTASPRRQDGRGARGFWVALAAVLLLAAALRLQLANSSLWWDEVWQARHASVGDWRPDKKNPGELKFRETTWAQTLWNYRKPANHPPMSVTSKACHLVWKKVTGAKPGAFNEFVLRLPGFISALAGIALMASLLRAWGVPLAGLLAAFFLALHPWHIRYGIDSRGYTFLVPLTLIALWSLWRACGPLARGAAFQAADGAHADPTADTTTVPGEAAHSAGAWWVFGITQALILWSHLLSVWVCLALCATGGWWIWHQHAGARRWQRLARLTAVQVAGAMVFFQLFLPNLLQATQWGARNQDGRLLDGPTLFDTLTQAAVGQPQAGSALFVFALASAGLIMAWKRRMPGAAGLLALSAGAAFFLVAIAAAGFFFYPRFLFAVIVPLAAAVGIALGEVALLRKRGGQPGRAAALLAMAGMLGWLFGLGAKSPDTTTRERFSPLREAAAVLREAQAAGAHVFGFGFGAEALQYYLPTLPYAREADAPETLAAAVEKARAAGRPLLVAVGYEELNRLALPAGFSLLDDASRFTEVWSQPGLEPQFAYRIRRVEPASADAPASGR